MINICFHILLNRKEREYVQAYNAKAPTEAQLNYAADDYFKAKKQISILEEELQGKEKELYDLKHELISAQIKLENAEKQEKELQKQLNEDARKIVRLETELKDK